MIFSYLFMVETSNHCISLTENIRLNILNIIRISLKNVILAFVFSVLQTHNISNCTLWRILYTKYYSEFVLLLNLKVRILSSKSKDFFIF